LPLSCLGILLVVELAVVTLCFDTVVLLKIPRWWAIALGYTGDCLRVALAAGAATLLVSGRRPWEGLGLGYGAGGHGCRWPFVLAHLGGYALFFASTAVVLGGDLGNHRYPLLWVALWLLLGAATVGLLALAAAPMAAWRRMARTVWPACLAGTLVGTAAWLAGLAVQQMWQPLAQGTFWLVHAILSLFYGDIISRPADREVGLSSFVVMIAPECSGSEGIGLIVVFVGTYFWLFRHQLSFPRCLLLLPLGVGLIWLSNAVRIALLVVIGASGWPEAAVGGFHSQAGWLTFLAISLGLVAVSARQAHAAESPSRPALRRDPAAAYLGPFLAVLGVSMLTVAFAGKGDQLYPVRLIAAGATLWLFRGSYQELRPSRPWQATALGVAAFGGWLLLAQLQGSSALSIGPVGPGLWARAVDSLVVVPIVEELAFRGYLLRRLQAFDFLQVRQISWLAVLGSSVLFGALHGEHWLAGTVSGVCFALTFCRGRSVGDAIIAHAVANTLLAAHGLLFAHH
jgi:exosortase E/protease (VPEID-CTERM system)